jgi:hypothetical protein
MDFLSIQGLMGKLQAYEEKSYSQKKGMNYIEVFALIHNIRGKL